MESFMSRIRIGYRMATGLWSRGNRLEAVLLVLLGFICMPIEMLHDVSLWMTHTPVTWGKIVACVVYGVVVALIWMIISVNVVLFFSSFL
jgi:hypothetical protein